MSCTSAFRRYHRCVTKNDSIVSGVTRHTAHLAAPPYRIQPVIPSPSSSHTIPDADSSSPFVWTITRALFADAPRLHSKLFSIWIELLLRYQSPERRPPLPITHDDVVHVWSQFRGTSHQPWLPTDAVRPIATLLATFNNFGSR